MALIKGHIYTIYQAQFPFDCPYGIYVETSDTSHFHRFVWDGKDLLMNYRENFFEEVAFEIKSGQSAKD